MLEGRVLGAQRHLHPLRARNNVAVVVSGVLGVGLDGVVDVLGVSNAELPFEVAAPQVSVALFIDGPAVEGARRSLDEN